MNNYKNLKVLIFGLGLNDGGVGSAKFFATQGAKIRVTDLKNKDILKPSLDKLKPFPDIEYTLGEHKTEDIDWADIIIKNPGVKPNSPFIVYATKIGKRVEMDMGIFLEYVNTSQVIGVTGTKGKSTTATLIYEILKGSLHVNSSHTRHGLLHGSGRHIEDTLNIIFAGNIGKSVLDVIPYIKQNTLIVLELSSFQLEAFELHRVSPKWAAITNITPDHLNYYKNMNEYIHAKKIIGKFQTENDFLFLRKNDPETTKKAFVKDLRGQIKYFSKDDLPIKFRAKLIGEHNMENMAAALAVTNVLGVLQNQALNIMSSFGGVPYRMELVKDWNGVKIINDTTATSPEASIQALKTTSQMTSGNVVLICGGMNKNVNYGEYAKTANLYAKKIFFLEGDVTDLLLTNNLILGPQTFGPFNNFEIMLSEIKKKVKKGDVILFSPAATSFNLFQNEFDRGEKFNQAVKKVFG
jgi:UDP-N-acetylmuramoylalanine--D-glutamate ligase